MHLRLRILPLLPLLALLIGCGSAPQNGGGPGQTVRLVGRIQPATQTLSVGEDLIVDYWISSLATFPVRLQIKHGSSDPEQPFQGYTFNAVLASNPNVPLDPIFLGEALRGSHTLDPEQPIRFQRIRWRSSQPGTYKLTFIIEWKKGEIIAFEPVTVQVTGRMLPTEKSPVEVQPEVVEKIRKLIAELSLHLSDDAWRKRAQIKTQIRGLGPPATVPLIEYLGDSREAIRMQVTFLMIEFGRQSIPALLYGCKAENALVRYRSAYALGKIREAVIGAKARKEVSQLVGPALGLLARQDGEINVRYVALDMLATRFEIRDAVPPLLAGLSDSAKAIRKACNRWLKKLSANDVGFDADATLDERKAGAERWRKYWQEKLKQ